MARATNPSATDFAVEIDFTRGTPNPTRIFKAMAGIIDSLEHSDRDLVRSVDVSIESTLILDDIEVGSLKSKLRTVLEATDDTALKEGDWKKIVGAYLHKAKHSILKWTEEREEVRDPQEVRKLESQLVKLAQDTDVRHIPAYAPISPTILLQDIRIISDSLSPLSSQDHARVITPEGRATLNPSLQMFHQQLYDLLVKEVITNRSEIILKVKKPDYLGLSMWDLKHEHRPIMAKIEDLEWLKKFQDRQIDVRPQDSLRARVRIETHYGHDGEVVRIDYYIETVLDVIPFEASENRGLF